MKKSYCMRNTMCNFSNLKHDFYAVLTKICNTSSAAESWNSFIEAMQNPMIDRKSQDIIIVIFRET